MKILLITGLFTLTGCGMEVSSEKHKPLIGTEGISNYFTKRNMTGEDFQNFTNKVASDTGKAGVASKAKVMASLDKVTPSVKDAYKSADEKISATKHKAAGYTGDRNITGDAFHTQFKDYKAKVTRKGEIAKGYAGDRLEQIRDPDRDERDEINDLKDRASSLEGRVALEEAKSAAQAILLNEAEKASRMRDALIELRIALLEGDVDQLRTDMEQSILDLGSELGEAMDNLKAYVDSQNGSQDTALAAVVSDLEIAIAIAEQAAKDYADANDADTVYDDTAVYLAIAIAEQAAKDYADDNDTDTTLSMGYILGKINQAKNQAKAHSDFRDWLQSVAVSVQIAVAKSQAIASANGYTDGEVASALQAAKDYADANDAYEANTDTQLTSQQVIDMIENAGYALESEVSSTYITAQQLADSTEMIDPCGSETSYDEILIRLPNGELVAFFTSRAYKDNGNPNDDVDFLTVIGAGSYQTTDGTSCSFTVDSQGNVSW